MRTRTDLLTIAALALLTACSKGSDTSDTTSTGDDTNTNGDDTDTGTPWACPTGTLEISDHVCALSGTILNDLTLTADTQWVLRGGVFVGNDNADATTLTIEPGTTIYGESSSQGMLVIRRGSKIMAEGTKDAPIVFTSSKAPGSRARGDWGGLILEGNAPLNRCLEPDSGKCEEFGEGGTGYFGGTDPHDSSGSLKYVIVEWGGYPISPDNELNGIAFQGVGDGTTVDYVQVHMGGDDGCEFFGGTVNFKHLLVTGETDDGVDWTDGYQGKAQFIVVQQWDDQGDNGNEADNNNPDNDVEPRSMPTMSNATFLSNPGNVKSGFGMLLREGTGAHWSNVIVQGFAKACLDVDKASTFTQADQDNLTLDHAILFCNTSFQEDDGEPSVQDWFEGQEGNQTVDPKIADPYNLDAPDYKPASGSPALTGAKVPSDPFFDQVSFLGGVDPNDDWTAGWTHHDRN